MDKLLKFLVIMGIAVGLSLLMAYPTMWVVNYLFAPPALMSVFWVSQMTFWKAFWLNFFCHYMFKGTSGSSKD